MNHEFKAYESQVNFDCIFLFLCSDYFQRIWGSGFEHIHLGHIRFSQNWLGYLAKRTLFLGPTGVINCILLSALS